MQAMGEDVDLRVSPCHHFAVKPNEALALVERDRGHFIARFTLAFERNPLEWLNEANTIGIYVNMTDIKLDKKAKTVSLVELLFFAYRDFVADADHILEGFKFGRAHHRVLHFVGRNPGLTVAGLLDILQITKQSLARVLKELIDQGYVYQREGDEDRRQRLLHLTPQGEALRARLIAPQIARFERACDGTRLSAEQFGKVFVSLIDEANRPLALSLIKGNHG